MQKLLTVVMGQQHLQATAASMNSGWYRVRQQVTHFYHLMLLLRGNELLPSHFLDGFRQLLNDQLDADTWKVLYFAEHNKGNDCQAPAYHLYHGVLEWRFLDLHILYASGNDQAFLGQLERTLDDLIVCAGHHYRSKHRSELIHSSPFMCRCNKELWLLLKRLIPKWLGERELDFWTLFHKAMQRHKSLHFQGECTKKLDRAASPHLIVVFLLEVRAMQFLWHTTNSIPG